MIQYPVSKAALHAKIKAIDPDWFDDAASLVAGLPAKPTSADFKPLWTKIKQVYIDLQHFKCCFCEKRLEGKIEQDVEHFRPKSEVKRWSVPPKLANDEGIISKHRADSAAEPGYKQLAYDPFNYAMACKSCNSTLKKNFFPIEDTRDSSSADASQLKAENALLMYPIGLIDSDPETLIGFDGLSPVPKTKSGFGRRRAVVMIEIFRLDRRRYLLNARAHAIRALFLELEGRTHAGTNNDKRKEHQNFIDAVTSMEAPFTNCMKSFEQLYAADWDRASQFATKCLKYMKTKSMPRGLS